MTNNKRAEMPESWKAAANEFLEYKRAAGIADTSLLTIRRRLRAFAADVGTPPELVTSQQLVHYRFAQGHRDEEGMPQSVHGVLRVVRGCRIQSG